MVRPAGVSLAMGTRETKARIWGSASESARRHRDRAARVRGRRVWTLAAGRGAAVPPNWQHGSEAVRPGGPVPLDGPARGRPALAVHRLGALPGRPLPGLHPRRLRAVARQPRLELP